jgi:hypothetical protein
MNDLDKIGGGIMKMLDIGRFVDDCLGNGLFK